MPILTKEGKEYKLFQEPPAIALNQDTIEKEKLEFHNFKWTQHVIKGKPVLKKEVPKSNIEEFVKTLSDVERIKPPEVILKEPIMELPKKVDVPKDLPKEIKSSEESSDDSSDEGYVEIGDEDLLMVHVLPVYEKIDKLYGERRQTYGQKFEAECILLQISDLSIQILTDLKLEKNWILYPSRYKNGESAGISRWWKVIQTEISDGNYMAQGIPSNFHPDFSN